jgi:hypothetical protein
LTRMQCSTLAAMWPDSEVMWHWEKITGHA